MQKLEQIPVNNGNDSNNEKIISPIFNNSIPTKGNNIVRNLKVDYKTKNQKIIKNTRFTQFEVVKTGTYSVAKIQSNNEQKGVVSICKQFFIVKENLINSKKSSFVVTMISFDRFDNVLKQNFNYLENTSFKGIMIFSNNNGQVIKTLLFQDQKVYEAKLINNNKELTKGYLKLLLYERIQTKSFTYVRWSNPFGQFLLIS